MKQSLQGVVGRATTVLACAALAAASGAGTGIVIAGGALDPGNPGAEVYLHAPVPALPAQGRACAAARQYVAYVNAGQALEVADLFDDDAVILDPTRQTIRGMRQIRAFYEGRIGTLKPLLIAVAYLGSDRDCMVELASGRQLQGQLRFTLVSIDHFTIGDDGKFARMVAFARPPRETPGATSRGP